TSDTYRWYPKIIRAYQDCWSNTEHGAEYKSPIAKLLHSYNGHVLRGEKENRKEKFKYEPEIGISSDKHEVLRKNYEYIRKTIREIGQNKYKKNEDIYKDGECIDLFRLKPNLVKSSFQFDIPE